MEDTVVNKVRPGFGQGPLEAVHEFLKTNHNFIQDRSQEKFYLSFNTGGYLKKIK